MLGVGVVGAEGCSCACSAEPTSAACRSWTAAVLGVGLGLVRVRVVGQDRGRQAGRQAGTCRRTDTRDACACCMHACVCMPRMHACMRTHACACRSHACACVCPHVPATRRMRGSLSKSAGASPAARVAGCGASSAAPPSRLVRVRFKLRARVRARVRVRVRVGANSTLTPTLTLTLTLTLALPSPSPNRRVGASQGRKHAPVLAAGDAEAGADRAHERRLGGS